MRDIMKCVLSRKGSCSWEVYKASQQSVISERLEDWATAKINIWSLFVDTCSPETL